jgi:glycosyltransferase involved in cell wall biosynthesis
MSLISVVIPAYKRGHIVERAIRSVLEQTHQNFEILVVDDGSKDNTESVVASLAKEDSRIRYFCHNTNRGAQAARNTGARAAQGEWITLLDSDDYYTPNCLEMRLLVAQKKGVKVVCSKCLVLGKDESMTTCGTQPLNGKVYRDLLINYGPLNSSLLVAKEALEKIGYLDERIISYQDWDTTIRLAKHYSFGFVAEPTFIYDCRGSDTISANRLREAEGYKQVFNKHFLEILKQAGPQNIAHHYRHIADRYRTAGDQNSARRYQAIALLWWPFRLKTLYRKVRQLVQT